MATVKLYPAVPDDIAIFLSHTFNRLGGGRNYTRSFFLQSHFLFNTASIKYVTLDCILAASVLRFNAGLDGVEVTHFAVASDKQRRGIGTQFMVCLKGMFPVIRLEVWNDNREAFAFYKANDFKKVCKKENTTHMIWKY